MTEGSLTNQYITTIWVNLISIAYGAACGWSSSAFLVLQSDDCPFEDGPITSEQASWIGSILCVGGLLGTLVFGWLADRYGRKLAGCLVAIPQILGWVCIIVANNYYYLILARFWAGFAGGGTFVIIPLYVAEISEDRVRGTLGSMLVLSCNFGLLASFLGGNYLSYEALPWALLPLPLVFLAGFIFMPESPPFLMKINKYEESEKALRFFRGCRRVSQPVSEQFKIEMVKLKSNYNDDKSMIADGKIAFADFTNVGALAYGLSIGWLSPNLELLLSDESPLKTGPISEDQAWWIGSINCIGGVFGTLICVLIAEFCGRKTSILFIGFPQIMSWLFIIFATTVTHINVGRFLCGFAGGGVFAVVPMFVAEISEDRIRGQLGSILSVTCNVGTVLGFIFSYYLDYRTGPVIVLCISAVFLVGFMLTPESPQYLFMKNKTEKGKSSLEFYRGVSRKFKPPPAEYLAELQKYNNAFKNQDVYKEDLHIKDFLNQTSIKAIMIGVVVIMLVPFCGNIVLLSYTDSIFKEAGSTMSTDLSSITVAMIQLIGSYFSTILVDRAGRKILLITSALGCTFCSSVMGVYSFLNSNGYDMTYLKWIPISSLSGLVFIAALGVGSIPFVIITEILSPKIKGFVVTWCLLELWILAFVVVRYFKDMAFIIGLHGCMWISASCCLAGALFVYTMVPETKGKSFEQITESLKNRRNKKICRNDVIDL